MLRRLIFCLVEWLKQQLIAALSNKTPLSRKALLGFGAAVAAIIFVINAMVTNLPQPQPVSAPEPSVVAAVQPAKIFVHLVGEVVKPGIYELESGARVMDAIFAASGFTKIAEQSSVNLARELTDGEQVIVLKVGEFQPTATSISGSSVASISLNRASAAELEALPGVGPALAGRIVDWRQANGGFKKKEDLLNISGIGDKLFAGLKNQVVL
jgi:competence protein ComEA